MLAPSEIPLDIKLPQLSEILNVNTMEVLFAAYLREGSTLLQLKIGDIQYYPGETVLLSYILKSREPSGEELELVLYAKAFVADEVPESFRSRPPLSTVLGRLPSYLPQAHLALWRFPDDPGLLGLGEVWRLGGGLLEQPQLLQNINWNQKQPSVEVSLHEYEPAQRCVLRYELRGQPEISSFEAKIHAQLNAASRYRELEDLWRWARTEAPELSVDRPLGFNSKMNVVWTTTPPGLRFSDTLWMPDLVSGMKRIAAAIAALHRSDLMPSKTVDFQDEVDTLTTSHEVLNRFYPEHEQRLRSIIAALLAEQPKSLDHMGPIHGNLNCDQVFRHRQKISVRDFDHFALGDPLQDVACFLAAFRACTIGVLKEEDMEAAQQSFLSTYEILVPWSIQYKRLTWIIAARMVSQQVSILISKLAKGNSTAALNLLQGTEKVVSQWKAI